LGIIETQQPTRLQTVALARRVARLYHRNRTWSRLSEYKLRYSDV
jgi:hypothetical protein